MKNNQPPHSFLGGIHLIPEYENPGDKITVYMLQNPATNTAEILRSGDRGLNGKLFPEHLIGYGTLPVLDLSSLGKHERFSRRCISGLLKL